MKKFSIIVLASLLALSLTLDLQSFNLSTDNSTLVSKKEFWMSDYGSQCESKCTARLDYPFVQLQCCKKQFQGTLMTLISNTGSSTLTSTSMDSQGNLQALAVESLLRITTYNKSKGFMFKVEDSFWINEGSIFEQVKIFNVAKYSYYIVTIESVPISPKTPKIADLTSINPDALANTDFPKTDFAKNPIYLSQGENGDEFMSTHFSGSNPNASSGKLATVKYTKKLRVWQMERTFKLDYRIYPINIFDLDRIFASGNPPLPLGEEKFPEAKDEKFSDGEIMLGDFGYDNRFGRGVFWVKDASEKFFFFQSRLESLNFNKTQKFLDMRKIVGEVLEAKYDDPTARLEKFKIQKVHSFKNLLFMSIQVQLRPLDILVENSILLSFYVNRFYLDWFIRSGIDTNPEILIESTLPENYPDTYQTVDLADKTNYSVSGFGGYCRCPSGYVYAVSARSDDCDTLNCESGEKVSCEKKSGVWSSKGVSCDRIDDRTEFRDDKIPNDSTAEEKIPDFPTS